MRVQAADGPVEAPHLRVEELVDRGADGDDHHLGGADRGRVGRRPEPAGGQGAGQFRLGPPFEERHRPGRHLGDAVGLVVEQGDVGRHRQVKGRVGGAPRRLPGCGGGQVHVIDEGQQLLAGKVLFHSPDRDAVYAKILEYPEGCCYGFRFLGEIPKDMVLIL